VNTIVSLLDIDFELHQLLLSFAIPSLTSWLDTNQITPSTSSIRSVGFGTSSSSTDGGNRIAGDEIDISDVFEEEETGHCGAVSHGQEPEPLQSHEEEGAGLHVDRYGIGCLRRHPQMRFYFGAADHSIGGRAVRKSEVYYHLVEYSCSLKAAGKQKEEETQSFADYLCCTFDVSSVTDIGICINNSNLTHLLSLVDSGAAGASMGMSSEAVFGTEIQLIRQALVVRNAAVAREMDAVLAQWHSGASGSSGAGNGSSRGRRCGKRKHAAGGEESGREATVTDVQLCTEYRSRGSIPAQTATDTDISPPSVLESELVFDRQSSPEASEATKKRMSSILAPPSVEEYNYGGHYRGFSDPAHVEFVPSSELINCLPSPSVAPISTAATGPRPDPSDSLSHQVGRFGEALVYQYLMKLHSPVSNSDGAARLVGLEWVNREVESRAPYDLVLRLQEPGNTFVSTHYIEVKSTRSDNKHIFEFSLAELEFMWGQGNGKASLQGQISSLPSRLVSYDIYRVYGVPVTVSGGSAASVSSTCGIRVAVIRDIRRLLTEQKLKLHLSTN